MIKYIFGGFLCCTLLACNSGNRRVLDLGAFEYNTVNLFVFSVHKYHNGQLTNNDTIGLFTSNFILKDYDNQLATQWHFITVDSNGRYEIKSSNNSHAGMIANDTILYLHPPRFSYMSILQFCPHPLFKTGKSWTWQLNIGKNWAIDSVFPIATVDTFNFEYINRGTVKKETSFGSLPCWHVVANGFSRYGRTHGNYYLNATYGIISFQLQTKGEAFSFNLLNRYRGTSDRVHGKNIVRLMEYHRQITTKQSPYDLNFIR